MKKNIYRNSLVFGITILFFMTILIPTFEAQFVENNIIPEHSMNNNFFTHCILGEYYTTTTCPACPTANSQMYQVYNDMHKQ